MLEKIVLSLLKRNGIDDVLPGSPEFQRLCYLIIKAEIQLLPLQQRHLQGDFSYGKELSQILSKVFPFREKPLIEVLAPAQPQQTLTEVAEKYWREREPRWKPRTCTEYRTCYKQLLKFLGENTPITAIDFTKAQKYKEFLQKKTVRKNSGLSTTRINLYLDFAEAVFRFAERNHFVKSNLFSGLKIPEKGRRAHSSLLKPEAEPATATPPPLASGRAEVPSLPAGHPPIGEAPPPAMGASGAALAPPPPGSGTGSAALAWETHAGWVSEKPASAMRKAQYRVPGPSGDGECIVFYFGPGQGGGAQANVERWVSQFTLPDGRPASAVARTNTYKAGDIQVTTVELTGTYDSGQTMSAAPPKPLPNAVLLGAIAEGPDANWFFKFTGPEATVKANRDKFDAMVKSVKRGA